MWWILFKIWERIPFGYLLRFEFGPHQVTITKNGYAIIESDGSTDALPLPYCSGKLIKEVERRLELKYRLPANDPRG